MIISKWTTEKIIAEINTVMLAMNINRMPSRNEMHLIRGSGDLENIIMKRGGFYYWANKLGLELKQSASTTGIKYEKICKEKLESLGYEAELTTMKFPYDILVNKAIKIDVKVSNGYTGSCGFFFTFNLESNIPKSDIYVFYCNNKQQNKILIIPSTYLCGIGQLSVGLCSTYDIYKDKWDYIKKFDAFYKSLVS